MELLSFTKCWHRVLSTSLLLMFSSSVLSQDESGIRLKTTEPTLTASPNVCEIKDNAASCSILVALVWEVPKSGQFCLYHEQSKKMLQCWESAYSGVYRYAFDSGIDGTFLLTRGEAGAVAARAKLKVIGAIEQQLRARRRSGFWRIF